MTTQTTVPAEIRGWNWGAFLLNWIWGICNSTYIALLCLIPFVNIVMIFVLGAKGNEWAWVNGRWDNVQHFKRVQRQWAIAGLIVLVVGVLVNILVFAGVASIASMSKNSEASRLSQSAVVNSVQVQETLGAPVKVTDVTNSNYSSQNGYKTASYTFTVKGTQYTGVANSSLINMGGEWKMQQLYVDVPALNGRIVLKSLPQNISN